MNSDHLPQDADSHGLGAISGNETGNPSHSLSYIPPASLLKVMQEQVDYLIGHLTDYAGSQCSPDCPDCRRLEEVSACLLKPFS